MLELLVLLFRFATFGGGGVTGHGLVLLAVLTLIKYVVRARKRAGEH